MGEAMVKNDKIMTASYAPNIRQLVDIANELNIGREDIVTILPVEDGYMMIYYYGGK